MGELTRESAPRPLTPYVCMTCGDARGSIAGLVPYCVNHPGGGLPMLAFPLERLRVLLGASRDQSSEQSANKPASAATNHEQRND